MKPNAQHQFCASGAEVNKSTFGTLLNICTIFELGNKKAPPAQSCKPLAVILTNTVLRTKNK